MSGDSKVASLATGCIIRELLLSWQSKEFMRKMIYFQKPKCCQYRDQLPEKYSSLQRPPLFYDLRPPINRIIVDISYSTCHH